MNALIGFYYLHNGRKMVYLNINESEFSEVLETGKLVRGGRWYFLNY